MDELGQVMPEMRRLTAAKMSDEQTSTMSEILDKLIRYTMSLYFCLLSNAHAFVLDLLSISQDIIYLTMP